MTSGMSIPLLGFTPIALRAGMFVIILCFCKFMSPQLVRGEEDVATWWPIQLVKVEL